jgi:hypothetical protein
MDGRVHFSLRRVLTPGLSSYRWQWLKQGRYWVAFTALPDGYAITAIFFETANIPGRL